MAQANDVYWLTSSADEVELDEPGVVAHRWIAPDDVPGFLRSMDAMLCLSSSSLTRAPSPSASGARNPARSASSPTARYMAPVSM